MPNTGWLSPTSVGTHAGTSGGWPSAGTGVWYATPFIRVADGSAAYIGPQGTNLANGQYTEWLRAENFSPTIPSDAIVTGVAIRLNIRRSRGSVNLVNITLVRDGYLSQTLRQPNRALSGSYEVITFGGERDNWGYTGLNRTAVLDSTFGVRLQCRATAAASNVDVDYVQACFYYTQTQNVQTTPNYDVDFLPALTARLGSITVPGTKLTYDTDDAASSGSILGSVSAAVSPIYDVDYIEVAGTIKLSDYRTFYPLGTCYDTDYVPDAGAISYSSVSVQTIATYDSDTLDQVGEFFYSTVTAAPSENYDYDYLKDAVIRFATRISGITPVFDRDALSIDGVVQIIWSVLTLHPDFLRNSQQSQIQAFPLLITITHKDLPAPLRFTDAGTSLASRNNLYTALPITITLPMNGRGQRAEGSIVLPVQSRQVRGIFRTLTGKPATVTIEMVRGSDPDIVEDTWTMRLAGTETGTNVVLALNDGDFEDRMFPPLIFDARWQAVHD